MRRNENYSLNTDIYIILLLVCSIMTAIFVGISSNLMILNCVFLAITCFLVLITYFLGLLAGLIFNLLFVLYSGKLCFICRCGLRKRTRFMVNCLDFLTIDLVIISKLYDTKSSKTTRRKSKS